MVNDMDFALRVELAAAPAGSPRVLRGFAEYEADILVALRECEAFTEAMASAERAAIEAAAAWGASQSNLSKKPTPTELEAINLAERTAKSASDARDALVLGQRAATSRFDGAQARMVREYQRLTSELDIEDMKVLRGIYRQIFAQTQTAVSEAIDEALRTDSVREAAHQAAMHRKEDENAEMEEMRRICDPHLERDRKRSTVLSLHTDEWSKSIAIGKSGFPPAPAVQGYPYPEHTVIPNLKLHRIAKYMVGDKVVLRDGHGGLTAVHVHGVEMADKALKPKPQREDVPEAVYLVRNDSTTSAEARGRSQWVNEERLSPRVRGRPGVIGLRGNLLGWARIWPQNRTFEANRLYALHDIERKLRDVKAAEKANAQRVAAGLLQPKPPLMSRPSTATSAPPAVPPLAQRPASARERGMRPESARHVEVLRRPHSATVRSAPDGAGDVSTTRTPVAPAMPADPLRPATPRHHGALTPRTSPKLSHRPSVPPPVTFTGTAWEWANPSTETRWNDH
jgi:hypothetical protein